MDVTVIDASHFTDDLDKFLKNSPIAISRAMNEANRAGQTIASRLMRKTWKGITAREMKQYAYLKKATRASLYTQYFVTSRSINLSDFGAIQKKRGVSYKLKTKRRTMKGSFLTKNGYVMKRSSKSRNSAKPFYSITPTSMLIGSKADKEFISTYLAKFETNYFKRLDYLFKQ